jgi:transcriptional regulator with XRE-family HTH domain
MSGGGNMFAGEILADLRKDKGMSQDELAVELGISQEKLSTYERGKHSPPDDIKVRIAVYFNVSLDYLMGLTNEETSYDRKNVISIPKGFPQEYVPLIKNMISAIAKQK